METAEIFDIFPGIVNENEFYSHHFFAHVFQSRIKDWLQQRGWGAQGDEPAARRLAGLAAPFFRQHAGYPRDDDFAARLQWHRDLHRDLLQALGFVLEPREQEWTAGQPLPVWSQAGRTAGLPDVVVMPAFNPDQKPRSDEQAVDPLDAALCPRHDCHDFCPGTVSPWCASAAASTTSSVHRYHRTLRRCASFMPRWRRPRHQAIWRDSGRPHSSAS